MPRPSSDFIDNDLVQTHLKRAAEVLAEITRQRFYWSTDGYLRHARHIHFDSPLEILFHIWWQVVTDNDHPYHELIRLEAQHEVTLNGRLFRLDFLITPEELSTTNHWVPMAVEVDGHAFHERTPEQVTLRDQRDRALQAAGWKVFHFSFTEFTADPLPCVNEVWEFARRNWLTASSAIDEQDEQDRADHAAIFKTMFPA